MNNESFLCEPLLCLCVAAASPRLFVSRSELCAWFDADRWSQRSIWFLLPQCRLRVTGGCVRSRRTVKGAARGKQSLVRDVNARAFLSHAKITSDSIGELLRAGMQREELVWIVILPTFLEKGAQQGGARFQRIIATLIGF